jgi:hypothetical protein
MVGSQRLRVMAPANISGRTNLCSAKFVIVPTVLALFPNPVARLRADARNHGDVATVEEAVYVASVSRCERRFPAPAIQADMRGL